MTKNEIDEILEKHRKWLHDEDGGEQAVLRGADLSNADLSDANLCGADLCGADLYGANLCDADLRGADLCDADLRGANLCDANLCDADLRGANLCDADLRGANLRGVKNLVFPIACPEKGSFTAFKKCSGNMIVELEIPADAKRSSATGRKCRANKALVISITSKDGTDATVKEAHSKFDYTFVYRVGEMVSVDNFCEDRWDECAPGIHFFVTRQEAVDY